jgi:hypothetical protein
MADNVAVTAGSGTTIAADEVTDGTLGSVKVQYVKLMDGTLDGTTKGVIGAAGLKVDLSGTAANATAVKVDGSAVTQPVSAAALPLPSGAATLAKQPALGTAGTPSADVITVQGVTAMTALKVDASGVAVPITDNSGSLTVDAPVGTPVFATLTPGTTGGWTYWSTSHENSNTDLGTTIVAVKASAGTLGGWFVYNPNAAVAYVQIFDVASGSVMLGTTRPNLSIGIPAGGAANLEIVNGVKFSTAISIAAATTPSGASANSTALPVTLFYK